MRSNHKCVTPFRIIQLQIINFKSATNHIQDHVPINTSYSKFKSNIKNYFQYSNINYRIA